ncbi:MAG: CdaR family protein [Pyrinomonadaceae bacterium]
MPFQDIDETAVVEVPRRPSAVERWLRKIFVEDWSLKLLALAITLVLWFAVTGQNKPVTIRTGVQLNFIRPDNLDISNDPPRTVDVLLSGSRHKLDRISLIDLVATVDLRVHRAGERVVRLSRDRVEMELPEGVKIEYFQPSTIPIRLEPLVERPLEVEVRTEGSPPEGYEVYEIRPVQTSVRVRGPASRVEALKKAPTETISLEGRKESFTSSKVAIDIPDQKIDVLDGLVEVGIEIGERRAERSFSGVPARSANGGAVQPATASITLAGPASVISQLRQEDVKVVVDLGNSGATVARVDLPASIKNRIKLLSMKPSQFSLIK